MQCAKHQVAGFRCGQRQANSLQVTQLAHQYYIRVFTQGRAQGFAKAMGIPVHLPLVDQALLALVNKFDRVFNGQDMVVAIFIDVIHHGGKGGGLTGAGRACNQHQAAGHQRQFFENIPHTQLLQGQHF